MPDRAATAGRFAVVATTVALVLVALALPVLTGFAFATAPGHAWSEAVAVAVGPWERGPWKVLRGGLKWITPPVLAVGVPWALIAAARGGRRRTALTALVLGAGAFLTSEAIKLGILPFPAYGPDGGRNLSGHVAMVAAALVAMVLVAPSRHRGAVAWIAGALLAAASFGIVVARWHDTGDVVIPIVVATSWAMVGLAAARLRGVGAPPTAGGRSADPPAAPALPVLPDLPERWVVRAVVPVGLGCAAGTLLLVLVGEAASGTSRLQTLGATALAVVAATILLTLVTLGSGTVLGTGTVPATGEVDPPVHPEGEQP